MDYIAEQLRPLAIPIDDCRIDPANARRGHAIDRIAGSLSRYGQRKPIVVNRSEGMKIEAGNGTWRAAKSLGWAYIAAVIVEDDPMTAVGYGIADNRLGDVSEWDMETLQALVDGLDPELELVTGFDGDELADMLAELGAGLDDNGAGEPSDAEPQTNKTDELRQKWGVEPGQLWRLPSRTPGQEHRLICGDCTDAAVVERVMGGEKAQVVFTSPPYWVGFDYEQENKWQEVLNFINRFSVLYVGHVFLDGRIIINTGTVQAGGLTGMRAHMRLLIDTWAQSLERQGWLMRYVRFWVKDGGLLHTAPQSDCIDQHTEFIGYFYNPSADFRGQERTGEPWAGKGYWDDIQGAARQSGHVAAFPLSLPERNLLLFTREREVVLEPFSGSGTTIIAAENLARQCRAVEILPGYVAVALQRYQDAFGITPELITDTAVPPTPTEAGA